MSYASFSRFLHETGRGDNALDTVILPQIEKQVVYSLLAVREQMEVIETSNYRAFNLLGYDFMLDDELNVYLIEVNASPTTDPKLIPGLVVEVVRTAIDPVFPPHADVKSPPLQDDLTGTFKLLWNSKRPP